MKFVLPATIALAAAMTCGTASAQSRGFDFSSFFSQLTERINPAQQRAKAPNPGTVVNGGNVITGTNGANGANGQSINVTSFSSNGQSGSSGTVNGQTVSCPGGGISIVNGTVTCL